MQAERHYRAGDRIDLDGASGTVHEIYPDGIHLVRLDRSARLIATLASHLSPRCATQGDSTIAGRST